MLSQEKQPANNNYWAASEYGTWNPASWNDHKRHRRLSPALEEQSLAGTAMAGQVARQGRQVGGVGLERGFVKVCYLVESDGA